MEGILTKKQVITSLLILIIAVQFTAGQDIKRPSSTPDYYEIAEQLYEKEKYYEAIDYYEKALEERRYRRKYELKYHLAESYRHARMYDKAKPIYRELAKDQVRQYPLSMLYLGMMEKADEEYKDAIESFETYLSSPYKESPYTNQAKEELEECRKAIQQQDNPLVKEVEPLNNAINKAFSNYGAIYHKDTLWFVGTHEVRRGSKKVPLEDSKGKYDYFYANRLYYAPKSMGEWNERVLVQIKLKDKHSHVLSPTFSVNSNYVFFTICTEKGEKEICKIYKSKYNGGELYNPVELKAPANVSGASSKHPYITGYGNRQILFFTSDRQNSKGGFDLYYCFLDDNETCDEPVNIDILNTESNEHSPFYDSKLKTLFFSSNGLTGIGGFDVFKSEGDPQNGWTEPEPLGYPVNSGSDDYYYSHYPNDEGTYTAFISSNRENNKVYNTSTVCDNIFSFDYIPGSDNEYILIANFYDKETKQPLTQVMLNVYYKNSDKKNTSKSSEENNKLNVKLNRLNEYYAYAVKNGYDSTKVRINPSKKDSVIEEDIYLKRLKEDLVLPVIYYNFGEEKLKPSEKEKLDKLAQQLTTDYQDISLPVASHTDNIDTRKANMELSKKRTQAVVSYLTSKGVNASRLYGQWYGEEKPVQPNQRPDGSDNPEGRAKNNRTEFRVPAGFSANKRGQMVEIEEEFVASKNVQRAEMNLDKETFDKMLDKYGDKSKPGLYYRIQIGAYLHPEKYQDYRNKLYNRIENKFSIQIIDEKDQGYTKFLAGKQNTLNRANNMKINIRNFLIDNAFIVPYYNNKRINLVDVFELLAE